MQNIFKKHKNDLCPVSDPYFKGCNGRVVKEEILAFKWWVKAYCNTCAKVISPGESINRHFNETHKDLTKKSVTYVRAQTLSKVRFFPIRGAPHDGAERCANVGYIGCLFPSLVPKL